MPPDNQPVRNTVSADITAAATPTIARGPCCLLRCLIGFSHMARPVASASGCNWRGPCCRVWWYKRIAILHTVGLVVGVEVEALAAGAGVSADLCMTQRGGKLTGSGTR